MYTYVKELLRNRLLWYEVLLLDGELEKAEKSKEVSLKLCEHLCDEKTKQRWLDACEKIERGVADGSLNA